MNHYTRTLLTSETRASPGPSRRPCVIKARAELFQIRNLAVGKLAPDIEGEDQEGKPFKLSDYRGKVVLLDFWYHL